MNPTTMDSARLKLKIFGEDCIHNEWRGFPFAVPYATHDNRESECGSAHLRSNHSGVRGGRISAFRASLICKVSSRSMVGADCESAQN